VSTVFILVVSISFAELEYMILFCRSLQSAYRIIMLFTWSCCAVHDIVISRIFLSAIRKSCVGTPQDGYSRVQVLTQDEGQDMCSHVPTCP
jgi:hypothetical protein